MKPIEICIHTTEGDDLPITIEADTPGEVIGMMSERIAKTEGEYVRFGSYLVKKSIIQWVWVTPKGGT